MTKDNENQELYFKQATLELLQEQLNQLNQIKNTKKDNNSFVYLEGDTLNMLLVSLLMKLEDHNNDNTSTALDNGFIPNELITELDSVILNNKKEFEEILRLLKK
ncbi:hypothetical protein [Metabacillus halosaccharovorans]|uniref:Uncharacterized protein n=1 Tax=Metabacillus halosaccharovorans TaxID=930124 RepID=A0ABT3DER5_9BACI|nr:hypothetical protein [Metabacillus halosaccharovorans]MCV9885437.1 hypothetical protein [Metabacillus halosaccharovorans]